MKTLAKILIAFLSVVVAAGVVIMILVFTKDSGFQINLDKDGGSEQFEFSASGMGPGQKRGYDVQLKAKSAGYYFITLSFDGEDNIFTDVVDVEVKYEGGKIIKTLSDLLNGETVEFSCNVAKKAKISITYVMSEDAGNEVQGMAADFEVTLTAERR